MKQLPTTTGFKFSNEERKLLLAEWKLSMLDPKNYPLSKQKSQDAFIALEEEKELYRIETKIAALTLSSELTEMNQCEKLASHLVRELKSQNFAERLLIEQMAAMHVSGMALLSKATNGDFAVDDAAALLKSSTNLIDGYQFAIKTLHEVQSIE